MEHARALEKLTLLEERISQTTERLMKLKVQYRELQGHKELLEKEIDELRSTNTELSGKINDLTLNNEQNSDSFNKEEVRKRLDRVLEKFGELQL